MATTSKPFNFTDAQTKAIELVTSPATDIMLFGGSRSGKTFVLISICVMVAIVFKGIRIAVLRRYRKDVSESICRITLPEVCKLRLGWKQAQFEKYFNKSDLILRFPNGSEIWFSGLEDKDRVEKILGKEFAIIYFNEVSQILFPAIITAKTRLSQKIEGWENKFFYDCNPPSKSHWTYRMFVKKLNPTDNTALPYPDNFASMRMNPTDNAVNLHKSYLANLESTLKGKDKDRFLLGEWTDDTENALWKRSTMIDPYRVQSINGELERIVVGVDPAVTSGILSDYTGIVVCGKMYHADVRRHHYYVLADRTIRGAPRAWAAAVRNAYDEFNADRIIAEVNQGGDLVKHTIKGVYDNLPITTVHAARGKIVRAEPVAAIYEEGLVHHVGEFPMLEDEMCSYTGPSFDESPDRMDALVWAMTELMGSSSSRVLPFSMV